MIDLTRIETVLSRKAQAFVHNRDGNVALMFGLALMPILAGVGAAIDYSRASNARTQLSVAVDSTVLALARRAPLMSDAQLRVEAESYFRSVLKDRTDLASLPLVVNRSDKRLAITAAGIMPTNFMKLFGKTSLPVSTLSEAAIGQRKAEIALVLDNTGSMATRNKMEELKKATRNLISAAEQASPTGAGYLKIALVPFDTHVKLDPVANRNASWLATRDAATEPTFDDIRDRTTPNRSRMAMRASWPGCITDRAGGYESNTRPSVLALAASLHPAMTCREESQSLAVARPLTDNWPALRATIDSMTPSGFTNLTIGARFGYAALSPAGSGPLGGGVAFGTPDVDKYMILLTDGDNTRDRFSDGAAAIDPRARAMCNDIKSRASRTDSRGRPIPDVKIFTVRVIEGNQALLRDCATNASMYKEVSDASQIDAVFKDIMREITRLQLTM